MSNQIAERLIDAANAVYGAHPGCRALHARGFCCDARFQATGDAARLSTAAHLQGDPIRATVRWSNGSGHPMHPDGERIPRGMAVKLHLPGGRTTDLVGIPSPVFLTRKPEDFADFLEASRPDPATGKPDMAKIQAFLMAHPESVAGIQASSPPPASYACLRYHAIHAFRLIDAGGEGVFVRFFWEPEAGIQHLRDDEAGTRERDYLTHEMSERLARGPVAFTLHAQLAGEGDDPSEPTVAWPDSRPTVQLGRLEITGLVADQAACDGLVFDPTNVVAGVELSDDPILHARGAAYSVSYQRRTA